MFDSCCAFEPDRAMRSAAGVHRARSHRVMLDDARQDPTPRASRSYSGNACFHGREYDQRVVPLTCALTGKPTPFSRASGELESCFQIRNAAAGVREASPARGLNRYGSLIAQTNVRARCSRTALARKSRARRLFLFRIEQSRVLSIERAGRAPRLGLCLSAISR